MKTVNQPPVTRLLTDEFDFYYDMGDMFSEAQKGRMWVECWMCGSNRTLQVGDDVFLLTIPYRHIWEDHEDAFPEIDPRRGFFAHGHLIVSKPELQLRQIDSEANGDLSETYYHSAWREDMSPEEQEEHLFVHFKLDSLVDTDHHLPIAWLQEQSSCQGLFQEPPYSGDIIPAHIVPFLNDYWERHLRKKEAEGLGLRLP